MLKRNNTQNLILEYLDKQINKAESTKLVLIYIHKITNESYESIMNNIKELTRYRYIKAIGGLVTNIDKFWILSSYSWIKSLW